MKKALQKLVVCGAVLLSGFGFGGEASARHPHHSSGHHHSSGRYYGYSGSNGSFGGGFHNPSFSYGYYSPGIRFMPHYGYYPSPVIVAPLVPQYYSPSVIIVQPSVVVQPSHSYSGSSPRRTLPTPRNHVGNMPFEMSPVR